MKNCYSSLLFRFCLRALALACLLDGSATAQITSVEFKLATDVSSVHTPTNSAQLDDDEEVKLTGGLFSASIESSAAPGLNKVLASAAQGSAVDMGAGTFALNGNSAVLMLMEGNSKTESTSYVRLQADMLVNGLLRINDLVLEVDDDYQGTHGQDRPGDMCVEVRLRKQGEASPIVEWSLELDDQGNQESLVLQGIEVPLTPGTYELYVGATGIDQAAGELINLAVAGGSFQVDGQFVNIVGPPSYCEPKLSSAGCVNQISTSQWWGYPTSGLADYQVTCAGVQGHKNGLLFGTTIGFASLPFGGGTLCVQPPIKRGPILYSGGSGPDACDGSFSTTVNSGLILPVGMDAGPGGVGYYQFWYRDPDNGQGPLGTALSDAIMLTFY